jgi:hypothetical protein
VFKSVYTSIFHDETVVGVFNVCNNLFRLSTVFSGSPMRGRRNSRVQWGVVVPQEAACHSEVPVERKWRNNEVRSYCCSSSGLSGLQVQQNVAIMRVL